MVAVGAAAVVAVLLLGSYVHNLYVGGWPLVGNTLFPDLSNRFMAVHYLHRVLAAVGVAYLAYLAIAASRRGRPGTERTMVYAAGAVYVLNIGIGAAHVFTRVGSSVLVAGHLLLATLAWMLLVGVTTMTLLRPAPPDATASEQGTAVAPVSRM